MKVAFFVTSLDTRQKVKNLVRNRMPNIVRAIKETSLLLPSSMQRKLLSGFGRERRFPTGLGYLSAILKQAGHEVVLIDRFVDPDTWVDDIASIDFIGIHSTTPCFADGLQIVSRLEREGYLGPIAFGGAHATLYPNTIPERVNYVIQGEAEYVIEDLINGVFPTGVQIRTQRIMNLDKLPRVDFDLFLDRARSYDLTMPFTDRAPIFNLTTSRSCPYRCTFCDVRSIWGTLWRAHSAARIVDDIAYLKEKHGIGGIYFREDLFTTNKKRVLDLCYELRKRRIDIHWACETRAEDASEHALVEEMAKSGCRGFFIGAESGSQRMLDRYAKESTAQHNITAAAVAKKNGIAVAMSIIVGDPNETKSDKHQTWKMVKECRPEILQSSVYNGPHTGLSGFNFPDVAKRNIIDLEFSNGSWSGQVDRAFRPFESETADLSQARA